MVLPTLATCTATPSVEGCSVVLPTLATCTAMPSAAGCSAVLPTLATCTITPSAAGCSVVLPDLATCTATPSAAGCSAVLPTLADCTANPGAAGCTVIQPTLATCAADPSAAGCATVLPEVATCLTAPSLPECSAGSSDEAPFVAIAEQIQTNQNQTVSAIDEVQPPAAEGLVAPPSEVVSGTSPVLEALLGGIPTLVGGVVGGELPNTFGWVSSDSSFTGTASGEGDQESVVAGNGSGSQEGRGEENDARSRRSVGQCTI